MKGNEKVVAMLNILLADELSAIAQYIVHAEMCANWGYEKLHDVIKKRAIEEMKHAEKLIERILFLEGNPEVNAMEKVKVGNDLEHQFMNDRAAEESANRMYNKAITLCYDEADNGSVELLRSILSDEEKHLDWLETQIDLIGKIGTKNYLVEQLS